MSELSANPEIRLVLYPPWLVGATNHGLIPVVHDPRRKKVRIKWVGKFQHLLVKWKCAGLSMTDIGCYDRCVDPAG